MTVLHWLWLISNRKASYFNGLILIHKLDIEILKCLLFIVLKALRSAQNYV